MTLRPKATRVPNWLTMPLRAPSQSNFSEKDPQRHKVYAMERAIIGRSINVTQDLPFLQGVANHACRKWKVSPVVVRVYNKPKERVFGYYLLDRIHLNVGFDGQNLGILLHELAHHITFTLYPEGQDHGPEFMDVYADLLDSYKVLPRACMLALCDVYGIAINEGED